MAIAIKVENISKAYQLGLIGTGTLSRDIERWYSRLRGKEDPFLKIGEANDRSVKGTSDIVWSLKDINFEINEGDAVGIIGRNGAGKSTLLKILSRVTSPTTGNIKVKGRIASLLEVGTGFHPELTGKENIYLNGAILGMRKKEITRKFDEIVDFSGVERYIDTPVKRYSSGMYVRLAFAVAAYLESETLIVDEVLAVGDAEFQKKCLGKMGEVSKGEGRTVLFVSHNMSAVSQLCSKGIVLKNGGVIFNGNSQEAINNYLSNSAQIASYTADKDNNSPIQIVQVAIKNEREQIASSFRHDENIYVYFTIRHNSYEPSVRCGISIWDTMEKLIMVHRISVASKSGETSYKVTIPAGFLVPNNLKILLSLYIPQLKAIEILKDYLSFEIVDTGSEKVNAGESHEGLIFSNMGVDMIENKILSKV